MTDPLLFVAGFAIGGVMIAAINAVEDHRADPVLVDVLDRASPWTHVLTEYDDGYGLAIREVDDAVELCAFGGEPEAPSQDGPVVYAYVFIGPEDLDTVADALSYRAGRLELEQEQERGVA